VGVDQRGQGVEQLALAVQRRRHRVEAHHGMQAEAGERGAPVVHARHRRGDEVEHRQKRPRAGGEQFELVAVLGQHRVARIDHVQRGVARQHLAQHLGLLLEAAGGLVAGEEARHPLGAVDALAGRDQSVDELEQRDRILHARGVEEFHRRHAVGHQAQALDVAGGAGRIRHLAEADVARQRAQQRGLAGVGVADHGHAQDVAHRASSPCSSQARAAAASVNTATPASAPPWPAAPVPPRPMPARPSRHWRRRPAGAGPAAASVPRCPPLPAPACGSATADASTPASQTRTDCA